MQYCILFVFYNFSQGFLDKLKFMHCLENKFYSLALKDLGVLYTVMIGERTEGKTLFPYFLSTSYSWRKSWRQRHQQALVQPPPPPHPRPVLTIVLQPPPPPLPPQHQEHHTPKIQQKATTQTVLFECNSTSKCSIQLMEICFPFPYITL